MRRVQAEVQLPATRLLKIRSAQETYFRHLSGQRDSLAIFILSKRLYVTVIIHWLVLSAILAVLH